MSIERNALIAAYGKQMGYELDANAWKGGWDTAPIPTLVEEVLYHAAKLALAVAADDKPAIREFTADVGNCAAMVADRCGVLDLPGPEGTDYAKYGGDALRGDMKDFATDLMTIEDEAAAA